MTDRPTPLGERPVVAGLLALTAVAVVVGLLAGVMLLTGTKILGVNGGGGGTEAGEAGVGETLFLPDPVETKRPDGPLITLDIEEGPPDSDGEPVDEESDEEREKRIAKEKAKRDKQQQRITLSVGQAEVSAMQRIDLTGTYPVGGGAILQVQRFEGGSWADFPVTVSASSDGAFATYVMTGQSGETKFRMLDTDTGKVSNVVTVKIG